VYLLRVHQPAHPSSLHTGPRRDIGHLGEGVRMILGHNPESGRVGRANQKRAMPG
jgi:hypothetical protein